MAARGSVRTQAIVLWRTKLSEQDLILTLLGQNGAQLRAVAKGARKPGGRLASRVELFCETDFLLAKGRSLDIVTEAGLVNAHEGLRGDYERVSAASAIVEIARLTCFEDMEDAFVYPICARALRACEEAVDQPHLDVCVAAYAFKVLAHEGWRPELGSCIACGDAQVSHFSASMGGLLCASCARNVENTYELGTTQIALLRALMALTFDQLLQMPISVEDAVLLLSLAHLWCAEHLDARLRAFEFLLSL